MRSRRDRSAAVSRRWGAAAALVLLAACAGCAEPPPRRTPAPTSPLPKVEPGLAVAYVRDGVAIVRSPARGDARSLAVPGEASAVAWGDAATLYVASGLEIYRSRIDGGEVPARAAAIAAAPGDSVARLDARIGAPGLVAMTAGGDRTATARYWEVDVATGTASETSARGYDAIAGRRPRGSSDLDRPLVSPSGRWELRVAAFERAVPGASERVVVRPTGLGDERVVADVAKLPAGDARYSGIVDDAAWAGGADTVCFVAETDCGDTCSGALFAVAADGGEIRKLGESVEEAPREWNGSTAIFEDVRTGIRTVVLADVATGELVELGTGYGPKWQPRAVS